MSFIIWTVVSHLTFANQIVFCSVHKAWLTSTNVRLPWAWCYIRFWIEGPVYTVTLRSVLLRGSETWYVQAEHMWRLDICVSNTAKDMENYINNTKVTCKVELNLLYGHWIWLDEGGWIIIYSVPQTNYFGLYCSPKQAIAGRWVQVFTTYDGAKVWQP